MSKARTDDAWQDFEYWTKQDKKTLKRILALPRNPNLEQGSRIVLLISS
jgi:Txe/YoeB family toxin of Txe-Axe toxin-antitoxin module